MSGTRVMTKVHYYQGVTIDARLSYQKPNGEWFMATVEATPRDRAHEVLYRVNWFRITAHAAGLALLTLFLFLGIAELADTSVFEWFGRPTVYLFLVTFFLSVWTLAGVLLSRIHYYRYIYAIAQFMRFHADAQWVAYDRTIFFAPLNDEVSDRKARRYARRMRRYYTELQRQCVRFGFGLMEIREDNEVRWLIEPSHIDQFGGKRGRLPQWIRAVQGPPLVAKLRAAIPGKKTSTAPAAAPENAPAENIDPAFTDPLSIDYLPLPQRESDYQETVVASAGKRQPWYRQPARFSKSIRWKFRNAFRSLYPREIKNRPGYYELPWGMVAGALALLIGVSVLLYEQSRWSLQAAAGDKTSSAGLSVIEPFDDPERSDERPGVLPGEYDPDLSAREFAQASEYATTSPDIVDSNVGTRQGVVVLEIGENHRALASYDCLPLFLTAGDLFLIQEGLYADYNTAVERAEYLNDTYEVAVGVAARSCLDPLETGFLVYLGEVHVTESLANLSMRRLQRDLGMDLEAISYK